MQKTYHVFGSGISGVMTALHAFQAGFKVILYSQEADPHINKNSVLSSTWGGGPTRMMTLTEGEVYLGNSPLYPDMAQQFRKTVCDGGWLDRYDLSRSEQAWLAKRQLFNSKLGFAERNRNFYRKANAIGNTFWQKLFHDMPELFEDTFFTDQIVRCYDEEEHLKLSQRIHDAQNIMQKMCATSQELKDRHPYLTQAFANNYIAGAMEITGYSFNVQTFIINVLKRLTAHGAEINFETKVTDILLSKDGCISDLKMVKGDQNFLIQPEYGSFHLGAYDTTQALSSTPAKNSVMGVTGLWMKMLKPDQMSFSMKAHFNATASLPLTDLNLIINGDHLIVGGGYIFTGEKLLEISENSKNKTYEAMKKSLAKLFPENRLTDLEILDRACRRSFTYDDLPRMDALHTTKGGEMIIYAGDNTGTTSMAPCMSQMVISKLQQHASKDSIVEMLEEHSNLRSMSNNILENSANPH